MRINDGQSYARGFVWLRNKMRKHAAIALGFFSLILIAFGFKFIKTPNNSNSSVPNIFEVSAGDVFETPTSFFDDFFATRVRVYDEIKAGENLSLAFRRLQVTGSIAEKLATAIGKTTNLKSLRPGDAIMIETSAPNMRLSGFSNIENFTAAQTLRAVELFAKDESGVAIRIRADVDQNDAANIVVNINKPQVFKEAKLINGAVTNNIYGAILNNNGDAGLVNSFSDIFNWQFDFYRDTRLGDSYQMIVEQNISEGRFVGYGKVLAAEYASSGKTLRGFYFESKDQQVVGFFDDEGKSLKSAFLKAPLKLAQISSRFGMRFHPVQKRLKAHNGVDYGANRGTPFMAVAGGSVINAGYSPFNGNWVRIKHLNGYETEYLHATHLAKGVRVGARVSQGQVIGYVGKTGLATGYHLHFGMKQNGRYVNPSAQRFARNAGVPPKYMTEFAKSIEAMVIAFNRQAPERQKALAVNEDDHI